MDEILEGHLKGVKLATDQAARVTAARSTAALRAVSPHKSGDYSRGWTMGHFQAGADVGYRVKNEDNYQLTHLLEKGHAKVNGGRVSAKVHIRPVETKGITMFMQMIRSRI